MKPKLFFLFMLFQFQADAIASEVIDELAVIAQNTENRAMQIIALIDKNELNRNVPTVLSDIFLNKPIIGIRSNSRGESVLRLRGSDERQAAVFLDGASLSIPWDGRVDLGLLPVGMIDFVNISKGAVPIEYGSNAMLGAVEILSLNDCKNRVCSFKSEFGSNGIQSHNLTNTETFDDYKLTLSGSYRKRDHFSYSKKEAIPFAPVSGNERLNTDSESFSSWLSVSRQLERTSFKLSYLLVDAKKGVPPAGHIDPNKKKPRYWRYPKWKLEQTTFNLIHNVNNNTFIKMTSWYQGFLQDIDQFSDITYKLIEITKSDKDSTKGLRTVLNTDRQKFSARIVGNYQSTNHTQQEKEPQALSALSDLKFSQDLFSLGTEIDVSVSEELQVSLGSSYDKFKTPETGGRSAQPNLSNWASNLIFEWHPDNNFYASLSIGERTRFPTLRELYGVALDKFIINPSLKPESAVITDLSFSWQLNNLPLSINTTFWSTKINDAISKKQILENGKWFDQRYNIAGSRGKGFS
ncbi:MAG: TonB-dependent receptor, partial [Pseudomonadota bacterium]|nr:TonB-dependent receptor [Pseudomonadota bacterium]